MPGYVICIEPGVLVDGRYRVQSLLAGGATSEVFAGHDERLDRPVAIKVLRGEAIDPRRFRSEARLLANLEHPGLVRLYDAIDSDHSAVLVMELVDGPSLATVLATEPLNEARAALLGKELAVCLAYLHTRGVVHRDIKPGNILVGGDGRARLADFGIARLVDATRLTATGQAIGTLAYMAPEQVAGGDVGPAADIYALGLVLLEALSGHPAFRGEGREVLAARLVRGPDVPAELAPGWRKLLGDMTAVQPEARPSASDIAARIAQSRSRPAPVLTGPPTAPVARTPAARVRGPRRRRHALWGAIVSALALALVVLLWPGGGTPSTAHPPATPQTSTAPVTTTTATPSTIRRRETPPSTVQQPAAAPTTEPPVTTATTTPATTVGGGATPTTAPATSTAPTTTAPSTTTGP